MNNSMDSINTNSFDCATNATQFVNNEFGEISAEETAAGMQAMQAAYADEEQNYINFMLDKYPVVVERRKTSVNNNADETSAQRAEICRKSRWNLKVKKSQISYQHQFSDEKLHQSLDLHNHLQNMIADAEKQLLGNGVSTEKLMQMRAQFGIDVQQTQQEEQLSQQHQQMTMQSPTPP